MPIRSNLSKCIIAVIFVTVILLLVDFFVFQFQNTIDVATAITLNFTTNPLMSWGITIVLLSILGIAILLIRIQPLDSVMEFKEQVWL